ncbi:hypothetical protein J0X19_11850 [Hymenobacter sp. BT186]|uniref:Uncharacterized protein n=1 Tax=Hymenobacter telluris TaxID=2816474 RepID=A0A939EX37_9BACT|nr:hypothetical protein [Hymenobacter telluris]MBO0358641.1 hypothetical protein [Hymenobacter telluris]MBW3374667.1 hypothetical protein [Hymenobacter norwichensis]
MTEAEKILKMIETVAPDDVAMLDEIDCRVRCYVMGWGYGAIHLNDYWNSQQQDPAYHAENYPHYTRSRDALKAIRPKGWWFSVSGYGQTFHAVATWSGNPEDVVLTSARTFGSGKANKTEELAELHVIIQATERDRAHNQKP